MTRLRLFTQSKASRLTCGNGFYSARGCEELNLIVEGLMSNFARGARIEGVLTRFEVDSQTGSAI